MQRSLSSLVDDVSTAPKRLHHGKTDITSVVTAAFSLPVPAKKTAHEEEKTAIAKKTML